MEFKSRGKFFIFLVFSILLIPSAFAACPDTANNAGYVLQSATGSGSGADWANAYKALPSSLSRGCTYYVGVGTYNGKIFNDAASGTSVITITAPTVAAHGTSTGWSASYVGQANFDASVNDGTFASILIFQQPYYVFDGAYRGSTWSSGYGFHANGSSGNVGSASGVIQIEASNITVRNTEMEGSHSQGSPQDRGWESYGNSNLLIDSDYIHDTGNASMLFRGSCGATACNAPLANNITVQYSYISTDFSNPSAGHAEGASFAEGVDNVAFRYNRWVNVDGTGAMATANSHTPTVDQYNGPLYIYGNQFWDDFSIAPSWFSTWCQVGGFFTFINEIWYANMYVYNNTIGNINSTDCTQGTSHDGSINFGNDSLAGLTNGAIAYAANNIWWNSTGGVNSGDLSAGQVVATSNTTAVPSGDFTLTSTPYDFHLTTHISGTSLTNVGTYWNGTALVANTFNVDADGNTRTTWDQGAYELSSSSANAPNPPQGLSVTVQ